MISNHKIQTALDEIKKKMENGDSIAKIADDLLEDIDVIWNVNE